MEFLNAYNKTCPIDQLEDYAVTFIRDATYLHYLRDTDKNLWIVCPYYFGEGLLGNMSPNVHFLPSESVDYDFTMIHNELNKNRDPKEHVISETAIIAKSALIGVDGIHVAYGPDRKKVQLKHMGNVIIEDDVRIGELAMVERGTLGSTVLKRGVQLDLRVNVGHNCVIGQDTAIACGTIIGGTTKIGSDCWIGLGAIVKNNISICDKVIIGQGSNVVKSIWESGIYMGNPAKFYKPYDEKWNF